jgi:hypothetical protein
MTKMNQIQKIKNQNFKSCLSQKITSKGSNTLKISIQKTTKITMHYQSKNSSKSSHCLKIIMVIMKFTQQIQPKNAYYFA